MNVFCWGDLNIPHLVLDQTQTHAIVEINNETKQIPLSKIRGWAKGGDQVQVLLSGGNWKRGTVLDAAPLQVQLEKFVWTVWNASWMEPISPVLVPMPALEDFEEDEIALAQQYDLLEPLNVGDRIRIVLAGPPLEHLTGLVGTVDGLETFGVIPIEVDGHGVKLFRREQLDAVMDEPKTAFLGSSMNTEMAETIANSFPNLRIDEKNIAVGCQVFHRSKWPGKSAKLRPLVPT
jgi:hypothetical protein